MDELFKTILILSASGFGLTAVLLILKPITIKKFPAKWQLYVWIAVMLSMIIPVYKLIPKNQINNIPALSEVIAVQQAPQVMPDNNTNTAIHDTLPDTDKIINLKSIKPFSYMWFFGVIVFLLTVVTSYIIFLIRKSKKSVTVCDNKILEIVKKQLKIKRKIALKMSPDTVSPMLSGIFRPVIYLPFKEITDEMLYMIFLHELTHYKRKDLIIKWFSVFVNAVHWFNPLAYMLCASISEACEIACDMEVTKNMNQDEQKLYMNTILYLVEAK